MLMEFVILKESSSPRQEIKLWISLPKAPDLQSITLSDTPKKKLKPLKGYSFKGYKNPDGSVGTKNILGITTSVQCVAGLANFVAKKIKQELLPKYSNVDDVVAINHDYGCGIAINAPAAIIPIRTIQNITTNPKCILGYWNIYLMKHQSLNQTSKT